MTEQHSPLIDVYPVGVLAELLRLGRALRSRRWEAIRWALGRLGSEAGHIARRARARRWREVKNSFNGYLAEHRTLGTRCGSGWTKRRALTDLYGHLAERVALHGQDD